MAPTKETTPLIAQDPKYQFCLLFISALRFQASDISKISIAYDGLSDSDQQTIYKQQI